MAQLVRVIRRIGRGIVFSFFTGPSAQIGVDHIPLNRSRPDDGDLNHKVVKFAWLQARQHVHLCATFDLKNANTVTTAQHIISSGIVLFDASEG